MNAEISVILPIYNQEAFLRQCLKSTADQTFKNIEIICIDDGSSDRSMEIVKEFSKKDNRIQILTQEHKGAGAARNLGLENASGEFLVFWDSDDFFELDALHSMYEKITKYNADICVCGARKYDNNTGTFLPAPTYLRPEFTDGRSVFSIGEIPSRIFNFTTNVPWNKMFRRSFIEEKHIRWQEIPRSNDTFFVMTALALANRICITDKTLINYRINNTSSLMGQVSTRPLCVCDAYEAVWNRLSQEDLTSNRDIHISFCCKALDSILYVMRSQTDADAFLQLYNRFKEQLYPTFNMDLLTSENVFSKKQYQQLELIRRDSGIQFLFDSWKECYTQLTAAKKHSVLYNKLKKYAKKFLKK